MKTPIVPCIWFDGNAEAAAELYCTAFKDASIQVRTPLVVTFSVKGRPFMGLNGGSNCKPNASISFFNICTSEAEIEKAWSAVSEGGMIMMQKTATLPAISNTHNSYWRAGGSAPWKAACSTISSLMRD